MPQASYMSNLATCLCRQFQRPPRNLRILPVYARYFNASARQSPGGEEKESNQICPEPLSELLILEPPKPRKPFRPRLPPNPGVSEDLVCTQAELLLRFEEMGDESIEIGLKRPAVLLASKERYAQLAQELSNAFLRQQLFVYYHIQDAEGGSPPKLPHYATKSEIIDAILSVKWHIAVSSDIPQRLDVLVNKDIPCTRRDMFFILGKDGRVVRELSQVFQARIKVNVESGIISVNASVENFERLREAIQDLLKEVNEEEFDISWAQRLCQFNDQFITPIARITGTYIEKKDEKTLSISALDTGSLLDARRLLLMSFDLQLRSSYSLLYNAPKSGNDHKGALYPVYETSALAWNFREAEWGRWRNIKTNIGQPSNPRERGSAILNGTLRRRIGGVVQDTDDVTAGLRGVLDHNDLQVPAQHRSELLTEYEAIFGYLLHENSDPQPDQGLTTPEFIESRDRPRVLLTDVPGLVHITHTLSPMDGPTSEEASHTLQVPGSAGERRTPDQICIVKLLPSPLMYPESFDRYPHLELRFNIDPRSGIAGQPTLRAIHSSTIVDAMFPSEECDVRFRHQQSISLGILDDPENPQPGYGIAPIDLQKYMSESRLNPLLDDNLRASQSLIVKLPEWMISPPKRPESEDGSEEQSPPTTAEYISTNLEYRRELVFDWHGMELHQTLVQGGITGGKRSEFKLCWNNSEGADSLAETPRITELEDGDGLVDKAAGTSKDGVAAGPALEAMVQTVAAPDTEPADGISSDLALGTDVEDVDESGDKITGPTIDQSLRHTPQDLCSYSSPIPRSSFADFLKNTADLVNWLGEFLASPKWRFTTQSTEHRVAIQDREGMGSSSRGGRGARSGRYGRGSWGG